MGAEELETAIAIPLEVALAGLPDVRRVRSNSQLGVAQVTIEFEPDADYYRSRQFVAERVAQAGAAAAAGHRPAADLEPHRAPERDLRVHARSRAGRRRPDDAARPRRVRGEEPPARRARRRGRRAARRLPAAVPGAARSRAHVGAPRQPRRGPARGRGVEPRTPSGGIVAQGADRVDRARAGPGARPSTTCASTVVTVRGDVPVLLGDVADVREAAAVRRGVAHRLKGEVVSARVIKQFGADTVQVAAGIRAGHRRHPPRAADGRRSCASSTTSRSSSRRRSAASAAPSCSAASSSCS